MHVYGPFPLPLDHLNAQIKNVSYDTKFVKFSDQTRQVTQLYNDKEIMFQSVTS